MDRHLISRLAHRHHPVAGPLSDESVQVLLDRAIRQDAGRLLDLGCGEGAWLLRALAAHPGLRAVGVDLEAEGLTRAQEAAERLGVARRVGLHHVDAKEFTSAEPFDTVLSVGATHAFGGLLPTLAAVRPLVAPGGVAVIGDAYWQSEPSRQVLDIFGEEYTDLKGTVDRVVADGWTPVYGHISTRHELDDYEWHWTGSLADWALDNPEHPGSAEALRVSAEHRSEWLGGYRESFGFLTLVLRPTAG